MARLLGFSRRVAEVPSGAEVASGPATGGVRSLRCRNRRGSRTLPAGRPPLDGPDVASSNHRADCRRTLVGGVPRPPSPSRASQASGEGRLDAARAGDGRSEQHTTGPPNTMGIAYDVF